MNDITENDNLTIIQSILEKFPFLSYGLVKDKEYLGIIGNYDNQFVSIYILDLISKESDRELLLEFGHEWWWDSNRQLPINVFIKDDRFKRFRNCMRMFSAKDFELVYGPTVSLAESMNRRIRKKQVTLVRKMTD